MRPAKREVAELSDADFTDQNASVTGDDPAPGVRVAGGMAAEDDTAPGLGEQFGRAKSSFGRLFKAHVDLLRAEVGEIVGQLKTIATLAGVALVLSLLVANMLYIGGFLFLGEWLFGSIGWGLAHGVLFGLGMVVVLALAILGAKPGAAVLAFLVAVALTVAVALLLGTNVIYETNNYLAQQMVAPLNSQGVVAALGGALVGAVLFTILGWRLGGGAGGAVGGLLVGVLLGALAGWLMGGAPWTWPPAVGFAITLGLLAWPIVQLALALPGLDPGERFSKLAPRQSIEAANETKAWLEEQWRSRRPKLGRK